MLCLVGERAQNDTELMINLVFNHVMDALNCCKSEKTTKESSSCYIHAIEQYSI